ncbi:hypothetical protein COZ41_00910 [Candidatus Shapirobacteria bacterium CG_4_10_14_3_um_filter_35_13]|uniref:Uncharacterized protein n=1 Tax=Candidatus Shapirobacteria bacterium CG_4_10_14_3_um_filter_35_13 TaxID=1974873 RepID=A0A2M7LJI4_9BACT|nr:MAG: hypothetical protein COZ41_00910 [Candidatus Shapirobacteria bacterium CG_4_10_14_3_um_filter_35_13]
MLTKINEIQAKTILTKSELPGSDWVINPYNGCQWDVCIVMRPKLRGGITPTKFGEVFWM